MMTEKKESKMTPYFIINAAIYSLFFFLAAGSGPGAYAGTNDAASPEYGFGEKTEVEIMKEKPREAKIGVLGDMSGELSRFGKEAANGAELAADEVNGKGGIRGKEFDLLIFDTAGSVAGARVGVETFLKHRAVAVVGAATSEVSFAANKMINDNQLPLISSGSRRRLGDTGPYNYRNSLTDSNGVSSMVDFIQQKRPWKKFALFSSVVNDYSIQLNAVFKMELIKRNLQIIDEYYIWSHGMDSVIPGERGVEAQIKKMIKNPPDAIVYTGGDEEGVKLVTEMKKLGLKIPVIGCEDLMTEAFTELGKDAEGTLVFSGFDVNSKLPRTEAFVKNYTERFGQTPTIMAALAYDSLHILAIALEKAESLRPSHVRAALMNIDKYQGVTGITSIGSTREADKTAFIFELRKTGHEYGFEYIHGGK
ncbi:MAG: ABC transporter substrate-binding protein [Nitrospinota bacterium]|nr:ABC transporter substrate-binding protein [Nitrospinota bacterium]